MSADKPNLAGLRIDRTNSPRRTLAGPITVTSVVVLALAGGTAWWLLRPKPAVVRTALVREVTGSGAERTVLNASGYVTARREATVSSKVTGKVTEILIEEGIKVDAGQILARLDDTNV